MRKKKRCGSCRFVELFMKKGFVYAYRCKHPDLPNYEVKLFEVKDCGKHKEKFDYGDVGIEPNPFVRYANGRAHREYYPYGQGKD